MAPDADPYRTLGLERGAPLAEVKKAYRRLAKINHPDAAGEAALPHFLAIQAAYDQIAGPSGAPPGAASGGSAPRRAWDADPDRAGATYRAYGDRGRRARGSGTRPGSRARPRPAGAASTGPSAARDRDGTAERPPNKATLGSTSYDGAEGEPFEPDWGGASWYGTTSGTYWTLNPKEYADPRKHGPEYQMRGRRRRAAGPAGERVARSEAAAGDPTADPPPTAEPSPTHTATSWWDATSRAAAADPAAEATDRARAAQAADTARWTETRRAAQAAARPTTRGPRAALEADPFGAAIRQWLDAPHPSPAGRVGRAVLGWIPVALAIGWVSGEASGCARFSADCDPSVAPLTWLVQIAALGVLILASPVARIAAVASIATVVAIVPGAVLLLATSDPAAVDAARAALGILMAIAWIVGLAVGIGRELRRQVRRGPPSASADDRSRPVS